MKSKNVKWWDKDRSHCVDPSKISWISIYSGRYVGDPEGIGYRVVAWFNDSEKFELGHFETKQEAQDFVEALS